MNWVPPFIQRDWKLKLSAFGLAVMFWIWAVVDTAPGNTNTMVNVPISVEVSDSGWAIAAPPDPVSVEVHFAGSLVVARALTRGGVEIQIPISAIGASDTVVRIDRDWVVTNGSASVVVTEIVPGEVRLRFEEAGSAAVPLWSATVGSLPEGLALAQPLQLNPPVVSVSGAVSRVEALDSIAVEPLDLSEIGASGVYSLRVDTSGLSGLELSATSASVTARLEAAVERFFPAVRVGLDPALSQDTSDVTVSPRLVQVTLYGGETLVRQADPLGLRASISPEWLVAMEPGDVRVVPLQLIGVPDLVRAEIVPDSVRVRRAAVGGTEALPAGGGGG